jgi:hypothetical protein
VLEHRPGQDTPTQEGIQWPFCHFDGEFSPSEAEPASAFDSDALLLDSFASLGLVLVAEDLALTAVVLAVASGSDSGGSRTR